MSGSSSNRIAVTDIPSIEVSSMPPMYGGIDITNIPSVTVDNIPHVIIDAIPSIAGSVNVGNIPHVVIDSLPNITGTVTVDNPVNSVSINNIPHAIIDSGNVTVTNPTTSVAVNNIPHVIVDSLPNVTIANPVETRPDINGFYINGNLLPIKRIIVATGPVVNNIIIPAVVGRKIRITSTVISTSSNSSFFFTTPSGGSGFGGIIRIQSLAPFILQRDEQGWMETDMEQPARITTTGGGGVLWNGWINYLEVP